MIHSLLLCICLLGNVFLHGNCANCSSRKILNGEEGLISDGIDKYEASSNCEWLIDGGGPNKSIHLTFVKMATECSFDFLFIYDGNSYTSKLIATLSGDSDPNSVTAFSGYMLLHLFSDRNYEKEGFEARYKVYECPWDCSKRGRCENHSCICDRGYEGVGCQNAECPNDCSNNGFCLLNSKKHDCSCSDGYVGADCSLKLSEADGQGYWHQVHQGEGRELPARTSHSAVFLDDCIWVFGGFDLNSILNDLWRFCMTVNRWEQITRFQNEFEEEESEVSISSWPEGRSEHAVAAYKDGFYLFGGTLENGSYSDELWYFNTTSLAWKQIVTNTSSYSLKMTGHTLTTVEDHLYLLGGKLEEQLFLENSIYRISAIHPTEWEAVMVKGGYNPPRHLVGHSTVYHKESQSLIVFGGYVQKSALISERSRNIQAFNIGDHYWTHLYNERWTSKSMPNPRVYHSAVIMGNYLVVYGGSTHKHNSLEICYNREMFFYHLGCHVWVNHTYFSGDGIPGNLPSKGRFGHSAVVVNGNIMFIIGGYSGQVLGDLIAYKVPVAIAEYQCPSKNSSCASKKPYIESHCEIYINDTKCQDDPECVFCQKGRNDSSLKHCVHRDKAELCKDLEYHDTPHRCPGICQSLHTCRACISQGKGITPTSASLQERTYIKKCSWCVKEALCQTHSEPFGTCKAPNQTTSGMTGWWGGLSATLTTMQQCQREDFPAGLHLIKYQHPMNSSIPDELSIKRETNLSKLLDEQTVEFRGFIHPLNTTSPTGKNLRLKLGLSDASALLYLSLDETPEKKEVVANMTAAKSWITASVVRPSGYPVFPDISRGHKYYVEQVISESHPPTNMNSSEKSDDTLTTLEWNRGLRLSKANKIITSEFLEPFSGGLCAANFNCLQCLIDLLCSWCEVTQSCVPRNASAEVCQTEKKHQYLITSPVECPSCNNHVECLTCAADPLCEWATPKGHCRRRQPNSISYRNSSECPAPCHQRKNCSDCTKDKGECAWCKNIETCLPLSDYVSRYFYGQCTAWIDGEEDYQDCGTCYNHTTCKDCLQQFGCGWCGNDDDPSLGLCLPGDFTGNYGSHTCSQLLSESPHNLSMSEPATWYYDQCPYVPQCKSKDHKCHPNAKCIKECECNRGFKGDGVYECNEMCYHDCKYGECSGPPDFVCECDLGWTNPACNVSCDCNNHSFCSKGVGICDNCYNHTTGKACDQCVPGTYGDPLDIAGCNPCICNGHGDVSQGTCNNTGQCYCIDNTYGDQCDLCKPGYYGNPRNGGKCYLQCDHRMYITNITEGALGAFRGPGSEGREYVYCLWILSTLPHGYFLPNHPDFKTTIALTIEGVDFECGQDAVYVYDGIPSSVKNNRQVKNEGQDRGKLLGAFCGRNFPLDYAKTVYAQSGILSLYFEGDFMRSMSRGFNASYTVHSCPDNCHGNQMCQDGRCVCKPGFSGQGCKISSCPANCSVILKAEHCHKGMCECKPGFSGPGDQDKPSLQLLTDSCLAQPPCSKTTDPKHLHLSREEEEDSGPCSMAGHSLTTCGNGLLFLFGGYSLEHGILNDMWMYNTSSSSWTRIIPTTSSPGPRYHHAAACIPALKTLFILGGFEAVDHPPYLKNSKSLWKFNTESHAWSFHDTPSGLPPMSGHTLTFVGSSNLMVIGGFSSEKYFNDKVFEYNASSGLMAWKKYAVSNMNGAIPVGLYGHSSVYDPTTHTLYIYGGYLFHEKEWFVSDKLFTLDVQTKEWNIIYPEITRTIMWEHRVFHAATHTEEGMVVIGGLTKLGTMAMDMLIFQYDCSTWHRIQFKDVEFEQNPVSAFGLRAVSVGNATYVYGGFTGFTIGSLTKITLPKDICSLISDPDTCSNTSGCQICTYLQETENITKCYDSHTALNNRPPGCVGPSPEKKRCDLHHYRNRSCGEYLTCSTCLATHPRFKAARKSCTWCSKCKRSVCINGDKCPSLNCGEEDFTIKSVSHCAELTCPASDCARCRKLDNCHWSQHFRKPSEVFLHYGKNTLYDWKCMTTNDKPSGMDEYKPMSQGECPVHCIDHKSCKGCLDSKGSEGGSKSCFWSELLKECMAPAYVPLRCSYGECGYLYKGNSSTCPVLCQDLKKCSDCIRAKGCGWNACPEKNGEGTCEPGTMAGPEKLINKESYTSYNHGVAYSSTGDRSCLSEELLWSFDKCQPENECVNHHHTCDSHTEECVDTLEHFTCICQHGFVRDKASRKCQPVCHEGCGRGTCVKMDKCACHFGWVGDNCSVECQCNKHSNCESDQHKDNCTACQNNTKGSHCQHCKPMFVGDPFDGGYCKPCKDFCNGHTEICMTTHEHDMLKLRHNNFSPNGNYTYPNVGPSEATAKCFYCQHNTTGPQCNKCTSGHFRKRSETLTKPCRPCHCNGHSNVCNADTGENCQCKNNTETNCDSKDELECWEHQCARCKEYFLGKPTDGHQCYRQMTVDRDYCFDPDTQNNCNQNPQALNLGRTVFFVVQPKYLNVDIRITIDVTMGAADIFLSSEKDTFQVFLNKESWHHDILIDKMYTGGVVSQARRSLQGNKGHNLDLDMALRGHENITVNDDPSVTIKSDTEAIRITEEVPDFLQIQRGDPTYYKISQFKNIDEWSGRSPEEKPKVEVTEEPPESKLMRPHLNLKGDNIMIERTHRLSKLKKRKKKRQWHRNEKKLLDILRDKHASKALDFLKALKSGELDDRLLHEEKKNFTNWLKQQHKLKVRKTPFYGVLEKDLPEFQEKKGKGHRRQKRGITVTDSRSDKSVNYNNRIKVGEINAGALNTYITVNQQNSVLVVRNVRFRLVITLPRDQHDLKSSRFYIIVRSRGGKGNNSTCGNLYFRQDQPHIDLFVFFSVFFSCFFLFLALCVMFWKLRQSFDARRSRQMREREMECMASRPFAKILVLLEPDGQMQPMLSVGLMRRRSRLNRIQNRNLYPTNIDINTMAILPLMKDLSVVPMAIEPTDDGLAAVATVLFQLPGAASTHSHLCLGSSLTTRMVNVPPSQKVAHLRRRTSASSC